MSSTKRRAGAVAMAVALAAAFVLHATPAHAYATFSGHKLKNGVGG